MVRILALDPASSFGWVLVENEKYIDGGTQVFLYPTASKIKKGAQKAQKWFDAQYWLTSKIMLHKPDYVVCEDVKRHSSTLAGHSYGFLRYTAEAACVQSGSKFHGIGVGVWKHEVTGSGSAEKSDVQEKMSKIYPEAVWQSEDHSDAAGMAYAFVNYLNAGRLNDLDKALGGKKKKKKS